jgi:hypothetical protein
MRFLLVLCVLMVGHAYSYTPPNTATKVRELYRLSLKKAGHLSELKSLTQSRNTAFLQAFYGSALALEARESSWIPNKVALAKEAYAELNAAVAKDPHNFEIRFLRYSFSCEVPEMLKLNEHLSEDKTYLFSHLHKEEPLAEIMRAYFQKSSCLNKEEKQTIRNAL